MQEGLAGSLIWWLLIFYLVLGPQLQHRSLQAARQKLLRRLGEKRGSNVITLIHRQESIGLFGIPFYRFIDIDDSEQVLRAIRSTPEDRPIDLIINTPGGLVLAASQIARALKEHPAKTTVIVPHYAMSGGTLIALAADEILMDPNAVLGPVDPQIREFPAPSVLRAVERKGAEKVRDETLIMADIAEKAISQIQSFVFELLRDRYGEDRAKKLARALTEGRWTHDFPITVDVARELGLKVSTSVPEEVYALMELYPQPITKRHPSVEFIPTPSKQQK
jgi:ClpP class serine protease